MAGSTSLQEQCSIIAMYHAIDLGADLRPMLDMDLRNALLKVYPGMTNDWYITFLEQAQSVKNYIGVRTSDKSYKYGWYDGSPGWSSGKIPPNKTTRIITEIWDLFTREQRNLFGNKKDSWNTADVFIVKASNEGTLLREIKDLHKEFTDTASPEIFVGTLKTYMSKALKEGILFPISLKMKTKGASVKAKENNVDDVPVGGLNVTEAFFDTDPNTYFDIENRGELDFKGNSFKYKAHFQIGSYKTKYLIEQRMQGQSSKAEVKDIVQTAPGKYKSASAQTGIVPIPKFKELILQYSGEDYEHNIPNVGTNFTQQEKDYWKEYFEEIWNDTTFSGKDFGSLKIMGKQYSPKDFMEIAINMDSMTDAQVRSGYGVSKGDYSAKLRNKLRHLRFMKALINSKGSNGNGNFGKFICEIYYRAAKMNVDESELIAPFIKVSS